MEELVQGINKYWETVTVAKCRKPPIYKNQCQRGCYKILAHTVYIFIT